MSLGGRIQQASFFLSAASHAEWLFYQGLWRTPKCQTLAQRRYRCMEVALLKRSQALKEESYTAACSRQPWILQGAWKGPGESPKSLLNEVAVENTRHPSRVCKTPRFRVGGNAARCLAQSSKEDQLNAT